jgi:hypothetical protein
MSMGYLLPGPVCSDEDAFLVGRDDYITCMDTYVWDSGFGIQAQMILVG